MSATIRGVGDSPWEEARCNLRGPPILHIGESQAAQTLGQEIGVEITLEGFAKGGHASGQRVVSGSGWVAICARIGVVKYHLGAAR